MSGFRDLSEPFWKTSVASTLYLCVAMGALSAILFPLFRNEWTVQTHASGSLFALGVLTLIPAYLLFMAYAESGKTATKKWAIFFFYATFILIGLPSFFMVLR